MELEKQKRIEARILRKIKKEGAPMKIRYAHSGVSSGTTTDERNAAIESLIRSGVIWHENGLLSLNVHESEVPERISLNVRAPLFPNSSDIGISRNR